MANVKESLARILEVDGALGACIVDSDSGMMLGAEGGGPVNLEIAAAGNTEVVRAKRKTMAALELSDEIEDILITLGDQYHIIRPTQGNRALFIYAAGNTEVVRAKRKTMAALELSDEIEDILITLGDQYHIIRPTQGNRALFIYAVIDRKRGNLALARHKLAAIDAELVI